MLGYKDVRDQSRHVFASQGERVWIPHAKENAKLPCKSGFEFKHVGLGKACVIAAMGESLVDNIDVIKKNRDKIDIITCDKAFGPLLDHGIKADCVFLCDANILPKWIEPYFNETKDVKLIATCYANPSWTTKWKGDIYFYINKDAIRTEKEFIPIMPDTRIIPAGSNVSNAMVIFMAGCDNDKKDNFAGYDSYFLVGYDYSWRLDGNYYAWNDPKPKRYYMHHRTLLDYRYHKVATSENLLFSARWGYQYITYFNLPIFNCSERGILDLPLKGPLDRELDKLSNDPEKRKAVIKTYAELNEAAMRALEKRKAFDRAREELWQ